MCGRFALTLELDQITAGFAVRESWEFAQADAARWRPRRNICPTETIPFVGLGRGVRRLGFGRWGLVPHWSDGPDDPRITHAGRALINARSETAAHTPAFRDAFHARRCLVPASGFLEWKGEQAPKQPLYIGVDEPGAMAMAGLWALWRPCDEAPPLASVVILTCDPNPTLAPIHDRMPVILPPDAQETWLQGPPERCRPLLTPYRGAMWMHPVSRRINRSGIDDPRLLDPVENPDAEGTLWAAG